VKLAAGAFCVVALALPLHARDDAALKQALKRFNDDYYRAGAKLDEKIAAVVELAKFRSPLAAKALASLLTRDALQVRLVAARELAKFQGVDGADGALLGALRSKANGGQKMTQVRIMALRGLGELKTKDAAADVDRLVEDKEIWVAKAAVDAAGKIRVRTSVAPLIAALRRIEGPSGMNALPSNPLEAELSESNLQGILKEEVLQTKPKTERELLKDPIRAALKSITQQDFAAVKEWEAWWAKSKATFQVPD
jgi:HEAT repeat protein